LITAHSVAWAQATIAGAVRDTSGAILPGVTVEAASPALIEKVRSAVTDGSGRYRIENLSPGTYTVTFALPGFVTVQRAGLIVSGSAVIAADAELRVGGVQETITVTGETPVVDVQSTKREMTFDNETMRNLPSVRSYSYLLTTVPGLQTNNNNVNTGPVFAIFPIHGGRGVESRLTVDGLNISNPPGGNQPSNYVADVGNASEVTMSTSGTLGESETAGLTVPAGKNSCERPDSSHGPGSAGMELHPPREESAPGATSIYTFVPSATPSAPPEEPSASGAVQLASKSGSTASSRSGTGRPDSKEADALPVGSDSLLASEPQSEDEGMCE
jgi:hypothetical protein